MARIERIAANARQNLRRGVVFPETAPGGAVVEGERRESGNGGEEVGVGSGLDPAEVLDAEPGGVGVKPKDGGLEAEVEEGDASLAVAGGEEEVGAGGLGGEEVSAEGEWGPPDGGDERGKR